ncbi:hypothetical protein A0H76_2223 [Hepatospora eriocheir]|uniref:Uncharacterized protein n=1 Tax=Hepatospora eriocheir TaxID=1081669 RepID=A0A1X0QK20_9MICR|nr:hypothetical protein A0H76_2223 [Hepatospora eriocheir]
MIIFSSGYTTHKTKKNLKKFMPIISQRNLNIYLKIVNVIKEVNETDTVYKVSEVNAVCKVNETGTMAALVSGSNLN